MQKKVEPYIEGFLKELKQQLSEIELNEHRQDIQKLVEAIKEINYKEDKLNLLIEEKNELQELENQLRHVRKKSETYDVKEYERYLKIRYNKINSETLKKRIVQLDKILVILDENMKVGFFTHIMTRLYYRKKVSKLKQEGILIHLLLEDYYLTNLIEEKKQKLKDENFGKLKEEVKKLYKEVYIPTSRKIFKQAIKRNIELELIEETLKKVESAKQDEKTKENPTPILKKCKNNLLELYPIVLTTVDSVISNYYTYFNTNNKIDYIIIDEASQCDILSALPLLYLAKNIIIVGDKKQLGAITKINESNFKNAVEDEYKYSKENFLSSISKTINPTSKMLLEHYRCDYNIINYCNKFFYENKLKIYNDSKKESMLLIDSDKGKYVEINDKGYKNKREIKSIEEHMKYDINKKFIISPFRRTSRCFERKIWRKSMWNNTYFSGKR